MEKGGSKEGKEGKRNIGKKEKMKEVKKGIKEKGKKFTRRAALTAVATNTNFFSSCNHVLS